MRSICRVATTPNRFIAPGHSHLPTRRYLNTIAASSSPSNTDIQAENTTDHDANNELPSFKFLTNRVNHDTLRALTSHPLRLETITPVQERIIALLPDLARPWDPDGVVPLDVTSPLSPTVDWNVPRDILVRAKTGTGKTLAYIIPAVESRLNYVEHHAKLAAINAGVSGRTHIKQSVGCAYRHRTVGPLILAPTRELAIQIASDAQKVTTQQRDFEVQLLVGGASKARQINDWMESSRDLVVATPGRLRDLLTNEPEFRQGFKGCPLLVLDETDILLSMGFRDDIDAIVSFLPRTPVRQTFLFSATMPRAVRQLASWILSPDHRFINVAPSESTLTSCWNKEHKDPADAAVSCNDEFATHDHIKQFHVLCPTASDQLLILLKMLAHDQLSHGSGSKVILFCPTVQMAELFSTLLRSLVEEVLPNATEILTIHSKMKQVDRDRTRVLLRKGETTQNRRSTVLVGSDVSARGVDYSGVTRVIQIGVPSKETTYTHRIRRMARGVDWKEDDRPVARADLLLLPWEAGYMNWQLTSLHIKPLTISALDDQLVSLSPQSPTLAAEFLRSALAKIRFDSADIRKVAASLLGYYLPLTPSLRLQPSTVLACVSTWASECFSVSIPTITRLPRKFTEAYEQSVQSKKTKGLFVDGLKVAGASSLGKAKSKNRSVWEGANTQRKPKRWH